MPLKFKARGDKTITKTKKISRLASVREILSNSGEKLLPFRRQYRFKLIVAFLVPIVFIVALGVFAFQSSKGTIVDNYEKSAQVSMDNSSSYLSLLMKDIEAKSSQIAAMLDFQLYYLSFDTNSVMDSLKLFEASRKTLLTLKGSSVGIYNAYAFGSKGKPMSTLEALPSESIHSDFASSEDIKQWNAMSTNKGSLREAWMGNHAVIDAGFKASTDYYAASYIRNFAKGEGFIVFDLLKEEVMKVLNSSLVSDHSISAFVTGDLRETNIHGDNHIFVEQSFYDEAVNSVEAKGSNYVDYKGKKHLFVYSKISETGAMVCTLIPESDILKQLAYIRIATSVFVVLGCTLAVLIGMYMSTDLAKVIKRFSSTFQQVSAGDFTIIMDSNRKDEFGTLSHDMDDMLGKIKALITEMATFGHKVSEAAVKVSGASQELVSSINEVSHTVNIMGQGVSEQASDTEKSFLQMNDFAAQIEETSEDTDGVGQVANKTQHIVSDGKDIINELISHVTATSEVTNVIINDIDDLQLQSRNIGTVVETINGIASTTTLLSLNASIEAARCGVAGSGFAVIATQIRNLAEQSVSEVKRIETIIKSIQQKTQTTATSAKHAEHMLALQTEALNNTVKVFQDIDRHMVELLDKINHITKNMESVTLTKEEVLDAIKNIAAVTQQTLASSEVVTTNIMNQITSVKILSNQAEEMKERAKELEGAIARFKV